MVESQGALEAGARALDGPRERSWGELVAYVADPDGHVVAFAKAPAASKG